MTDRPLKPRVHHFVQAPVHPLDEDGVVVGIIGTVMFALVSAVLWMSEASLKASGHEWWLWTGISGTVLGVIGTAYCGWRKYRRLRGTFPR